jgi:hypothetical protein
MVQKIFGDLQTPISFLANHHPATSSRFRSSREPLKEATNSLVVSHAVSKKITPVTLTSFESIQHIAYTMGYRRLTYHLRNDLKVWVTRSAVYHSLTVIDREGLDRRSSVRGIASGEFGIFCVFG